MTSNKTIETSNLQNKLQGVYWKVLTYILIWTSVISLLFILKSLLIYFLIPITHVSFLTFMMAPENNSVEDSIIGSFYETIVSLLSMMVSFMLMMIASKAEKLYIQSLASMSEPQAFLFSLEIDGVPNIKSAQFLANVFESLQGPDSKKENKSLVQDVIYVFDMETYFDEKYEKKFINFNSINQTQNLTITQTQTRDNKSGQIQISKHLLMNLKSIPFRNFNGKMIVVLNDLEVIYDILNLYHCGLFRVKVQSDVDSAIKMGLLGMRKNKILDALDSADKNSLFHNLKIKLAPDSHNIIWNFYSKSQKSKKRDTRWRILICLIISCLISLIVAVIYYLTIKELLFVKFIDSSDAWKFTIADTVILMNWKIFLGTISSFLFPIFGSLLIEVFAEYFQCDYFSDYNNLRFRLEILYEFIHRYVFIYFAFTFAVIHYRNILDKNQIPNLYEYIYIEWNKTAFFLIPTTFFRYLIKYAYGCFEKCINKATPEKVKFSIDHSISSVNLLLTFMYLGFYFPVLSSTIVILLLINIMLNLFMYYFIYKSNKILRDYLSYNNISMLINHCLVAFNVGGIMSIFIFATFSKTYFNQVKEYTGSLPSNFIGSVFMLLFASINYMTNQPNSLYLRVLQNLLPIPAYKNIKQLVLKQALKVCDYRKKNPYYQECNLIKSTGFSNKDFDSSLNSDEKDPLMKYDGSYDNLFDFDRKKSKMSNSKESKNKFGDMHFFDEDLVNIDSKEKKI